MYNQHQLVIIIHVDNMKMLWSRVKKDASGEPRRQEQKEITLEDEEQALRATDDELFAEKEVLNNAHDMSNTYTASDDMNGRKQATESRPYHFVPLRMGGNGRTHIPTSQSAALIDEVGGLFALQAMTKSFYEKAFLDATLDNFIRSHDEPHSKRFASWIHQKLTNSSVWDQERAARSDVPVTVANGHTIVVNDRSSAHVAAWHSPKRDPNEVGRHFKLDECRVWMRLHFWGMRESVGDTSPSFVDYYVRFIGHFVNVYEGSAPTFARDSYRWSADPSNIQTYIDNGCRMGDVLGISLGQALGQIPEGEANDTDWPYVLST